MLYARRLISSSRAEFPSEASPVAASWLGIAWSSFVSFTFAFDDILISFLPSLVTRLLFARLHFTPGDATGMPTQFIESPQLYRAGNCRAFRNPDCSAKYRGSARSESLVQKQRKSVGGP